MALSVRGTAVFILLSSWSVGVPAADLIEIFRAARTADAVYSAAQNAWAAAQERVPQARAGLLPAASLSTSAQYTNGSIRYFDAAARSPLTYSSSSLNAIITQPLYRKQSSIVYQQALVQATQADAQLALAAQDLILRVSQAYFDVLLGVDNVALAEAQRTAIGRQLELAKQNYAVGTGTGLDISDAQARYDLAVSQEVAARNEVDLRSRALERIIGRTAPVLAPLRQRFKMDSPPVQPVQKWVDLARQNNTGVRIAETALTIATQDIDRNRAAHYPTLDAFGRASQATLGSDPAITTGYNTRSASFGIELAIPIYQGGAVGSRIREAIANQSRARDELENARRAAEFGARQAYLGVTNGDVQVRALEVAVASTASQLESTRAGQQVGVRSQIDVLNAEQFLFSARRDLAQSRYNYVMSLLRLEAAIGELTEDSLSTVNAWLQHGQPAADEGSASTVVSTTPPPARPPLPPWGPTTSAVPDVSQDTAEVLRTLEDWARAWASNDVVAYLDYYGPDFETPWGMPRQAWEAERKSRIRKPRRIEVNIARRVVTFDERRRATVYFQQHYRSGDLDVSSEKTLVLTRSGRRWLIQQERVESEMPHRQRLP